jgi:8-oxo-dGTP pyrophosphatase MutT (NUDIX family)
VNLSQVKRADNGEWVSPGGIVELDEDPRDTVRREVLGRGHAV